MSTTLPSLIYQKLQPILQHHEFKKTGYIKLESPPYMALIVEQNSPDLISMTHYYKSNGDLVSDPDMVIKIDTKSETAEAMSYQDAYRYQDVRNEDGVVEDFKLQGELNKFLVMWLNNLKDQLFFR
jgi:uncharacterized protein YqiB (DUF1249 family)